LSTRPLTDKKYWGGLARYVLEPAPIFFMHPATPLFGC
jgi:hypothetical protein